VLEPFDLPFVQRGMVEVLLLALAAGLIGTWVVLRGLAFFAHAVGTAAFPGLVLADGLAFSAHLGAAASAGVVAGAVGWMARRDRERYDSVTALVLVGALATGVILASDVFHSGSRVETLLFGSLLAVDASDQLWAAAAGGVVLAATLVLGPRWLATGFDAASARAQGLRSGVSDALLLALVAFVAVASLSAIGALLATALIVVPAATTRLVVDRLGRWQAATVALAAAEGVAGLWLSVQLNAPPGAAVAVLTGGVFALVALGRALGRRRAVLAAAALLALGAAGCGAGGGTGGRPGVVASTTQLGDIVRAIGGDGVHVTQILRPNTDPHDYEPRPDDVLRTADAALVVESGRGLDHWMEEVVRQSGGSPAILVAADRVPGERDPHWWHDPRNVEAVVPAIRDALADADPAGRRGYAARAAAYLAKVRALDAGIRGCLAGVPPAARKLVTDHDAFGPFARRYGIRVVGAVLPAQTTQAQPSAGALAELARVIARERVRAVFPEHSLNPKLVRAIAARTGATAKYELYGDTLGPAGSDGATYLAMERHNADAMVRGFTGGARGCPIAT
jgi:zinc/manganese transport system substrate-binding protein